MAGMASLLHVEPNGEVGKAHLVVDTSVKSQFPVKPFLFGKFCEHLGANIYHGMDAQILDNPTFGKWQFWAGDDHPDGGTRPMTDRGQISNRIRGHSRWMGWPDPERVVDAYFNGCAYPWFPTGSREEVRCSPDVSLYDGRAQRVEVVRSHSGEPQGIAQWIYLPLHRTKGFEFRIIARSVFEPKLVDLTVTLVETGKVVARIRIPLQTSWQTYTDRFEIPKDAPAAALYQFAVVAEPPAHFILDRVLLYPDDHVNGADPDVIRFLKEARLPILRWPGGNFASGYHWQWGIGPVDKRPTVPNPAWEGLEFNLFGTDEFIAFCRVVGCEPLICVNAGDGTPEEAAAWVEYCNGSPDTPMGKLRAQNGHPEPYNVRFWEIGNELYGRWQVFWTTPDGYLDRYLRFREAMLKVDPNIYVLACGYGNEPLSGWNMRLIEGAKEKLQCITDHILTGGGVDANTDPTELFHAFMGYAAVLEERYSQLRERMLAAGISEPKLAITELQFFAHFFGEVRQDGKLTPWTMPSQDTISEALYYATIVNMSIRLGNFVEMITHSATVNHGGGLRKERERVYANPVHYAHVLLKDLAGGTPLGLQLACATYSTNRGFGHIPPLQKVPILDPMAVLSPDGELILTVIHRCATTGTVDLTVQLKGFEAKEVEAKSLVGETWYDRNTRDKPTKVTPKKSPSSLKGSNNVHLVLQPFSLTKLKLR
ncbi:MAG: alpha-N-arabinofuranosidase [Armatimonadetes bacterium]|nr:alpha-N-arabinofuranosidase [Armatimonadota bacterium]MDW8028080.1 alpha-L-arabinofuranosidase C-terminal domain-containing protein [Armatimonadota bacterium]